MNKTTSISWSQSVLGSNGLSSSSTTARQSMGTSKRIRGESPPPFHGASKRARGQDLENQIRTVPLLQYTHFSGRTMELDKLNRLIRSDPLPRNLIHSAIVGAPGCGKSTLIHKFAQEVAQHFHHVIWFTCEQLKEKFVAIARELHLHAPTDSIDSVSFQVLLNRIYSTLSQSRTLLVFDDSPPFSELRPFLPSLPTDRVIILVTSQHSDWSECALKLTLEGLTSMASLQFLQASLGNDSDLRLIGEIFDNHPAALAFAVAFIKYQNRKRQFITNIPVYSVSEFINQYRGKMEEFFEFESTQTSIEPNYKPILTAMNEAIARLNHPLAEKLLGLLSFLEGDSVPVSFLNSPLLDTEEAVAEALMLLQEWSLVIVRGERLIQNRVLQQAVKVINRSKREQLIGSLLVLMEKDLDVSGRLPRFKTEVIATHAVTLMPQMNDKFLRLFSRLPVAVVSTNWSLSKHFLPEGSLWAALEKSLGYTNIELLQLLSGISIPMEGHSGQVTTCKKALSNIPPELLDHREVLRLLFRKAQLVQAGSQDGNNSKEAWKELEEVYRSQCDKIGMDNDDTLETLEQMVQIASRLCQNKNVEELETCLSLVYQRFSNVRLDHVRSLRMMKYLPEYLHEVDRDDEALKLYDCLQETLETAFGAKDKKTLDAIQAKAECLQWLGRHEEAWQVLISLNSAQLRAKIDNFKTLTNMCTVAAKLPGAKCWDLCVSLLKERMSNKEADHEKSVAILHELVFTAGRHVECLPLYEILVETTEGTPFGARCMQGKADCQLQAGQLTEAWVTLKTIQSELGGGVDPGKTLSALGQVACELETSARIAEWTGIMQQLTDWDVALKVLERLANTGSPKTARVLTLYDAIQGRMSQSLGERAALRAMLGRAWHCWCLDRKDEAWKLYQDVCRYLEVEPDPRTQRRWVFCNAISKLIKIIKDGSQM